MKRLEKEKCSALRENLKGITFNRFFAKSVIEHHVDGVVYVDDIIKPNNAYILHPYGMSILYRLRKKCHHQK